MNKRKVIFLDRDGTLCEEGAPPRGFSELRLFPGAMDAIWRMQQSGFEVAVVTNQGAVARGVIDIRDVIQTHADMMQHFRRHGVPLLAIRFCPHHPDGILTPFRGSCFCRKPAPGMLQHLAHQFHIDLTRSWMIGDNLSDVQAGLAAGCRVALIKTGHGNRFIQSVPESTTIVDNLAAVATLISEDLQKTSSHSVNHHGHREG